MTRETLDDLDRACLKSLRIGAPPVGDCCPPPVLARLLKLGLIKEVPIIRLPLPMIRTGYALTAAGEAALWDG